MQNDQMDNYELEHDRKTGITDIQEKEIAEFKPQAFSELMLDFDYFQDRLIDASRFVHQCYSDTPHFAAKDVENMQLREVVYMARMWAAVVSKVEKVSADDIEKKAKELWSEQQ
jgi:hypothetical protein